jgi:hypothetical protein
MRKQIIPIGSNLIDGNTRKSLFPAEWGYWRPAMDDVDTTIKYCDLRGLIR